MRTCYGYIVICFILLSNKELEFLFQFFLKIKLILLESLYFLPKMKMSKRWLTDHAAEVHQIPESATR